RHDRHLSGAAAPRLGARPRRPARRPRLASHVHRLPADAAALRAVAALGAAPAAHRALLPRRDPRFGAPPLDGKRRRMEGTGAVARGRLNGTVETPSGKGRGDENFPVGSFLIRRDLRRHVHAFYRFAREADDVADNPALAPEEKLRRLDRMAAALDGAA